MSLIFLDYVSRLVFPRLRPMLLPSHTIRHCHPCIKMCKNHIHPAHDHRHPPHPHPAILSISPCPRPPWPPHFLDINRLCPTPTPTPPSPRPPRIATVTEYRRSPVCSATPTPGIPALIQQPEQEQHPDDGADDYASNCTAGEAVACGLLCGVGLPGS
jgi:hypothetical protein